ncbi:MAG TPA: zinc ribbon domain-containing protein, partial [Bacteroidales bacterium]|nr:zinc ribbon domain-containing protein [Bacteroidales bacterium]
MKFCPNCGAELKPEAKFCAACGTPIAVAPPPPVQPTLSPKPAYQQEQINSQAKEDILGNTITVQQTNNTQALSIENIAKRRSLVPICFSVVIVFFFFNFFTVSCGSQKIASVTGIDLVTGTQLSNQNFHSDEDVKSENIPANIWAIIALILVILGLGVFLMRGKGEDIIGMGAGILSFTSLIILQFAIKTTIETRAEGSPFEINFHFAYWGALFATALAGFISYLRIRMAGNSIEVPRVINILTKTKDEWKVIATEQPNTMKLLFGYALILALIPAIASFISYGLIGTTVMGYTYRSVSGGIMQALTQLLSGVIGVY